MRFQKNVKRKKNKDKKINRLLNNDLEGSSDNFPEKNLLITKHLMKKIMRLKSKRERESKKG